MIQRGITQHLPRKTQNIRFKRLLTVVSRAKIWIPAWECEFQINTRSPLSLLSFFQKRPPETKQRVAQRRLGFGCMLHFLHSGQMVGFPVAGICSSSSQYVRVRTNSSMTRGLSKSNARYFNSPPPPLSACAQAPSDWSATVRLHKRITSRRRDAPQSR